MGYNSYLIEEKERPSWKSKIEIRNLRTKKLLCMATFVDVSARLVLTIDHLTEVRIFFPNYSFCTT